MLKLISLCSTFLIGCGAPSIAPESPIQQDILPNTEDVVLSEPTFELPAAPTCESDDSACIVLQEKETVQLEGLSEFKFESILEDSRCPLDAVCVWAGQVSARISYIDPVSGEKAVVEIGLGGILPQSWTNEATGTTIFLDQVWPAKLLSAETLNEPYQIKLLVKAKGSEQDPDQN